MNTPTPIALWIPKLFLASAGIAALNCYARADYNLPLFVFAYLVWTSQKNQKVRVAWLLAVTLIVDLVWVLYWPSLWHSEKFEDGYWENGVHDMVIILSIMNLIFKVLIIGAIQQNDTEVKQALTVDGVKASIAYLTQFR